MTTSPPIPTDVEADEQAQLDRIESKLDTLTQAMRPGQDTTS